MKIKLTITGGLEIAARDRAKIEGMETGNNPGVATLCRKALRYYLSQQRYKELEMLKTSPDTENGERSQDGRFRAPGRDYGIGSGR